MAFCPNCGYEITESVRFCPRCGQPMEAQAQQQESRKEAPHAAAGAAGSSKSYNAFADAPDHTAECDPEDIKQNKVFAILAYISILVLVPIFAAPKSKFAKVHANMGLNLFIVEVLLNLIFAGLKAICFPYYWLGRGIGGYIFLSVLQGLCMLVILAFVVLGIIYAATGKAKEMPFVNKIKLLK